MPCVPIPCYNTSTNFKLKIFTHQEWYFSVLTIHFSNYCNKGDTVLSHYGNYQKCDKYIQVLLKICFGMAKSMYHREFVPLMIFQLVFCTKQNLNGYFLLFTAPVTITSLNLLHYIQSLLINTQVFNYMIFFHILWKALRNLWCSVLYWCNCHKMLHLHHFVQNKDKSEILTT